MVFMHVLLLLTHREQRFEVLSLQSVSYFFEVVSVHGIDLLSICLLHESPE